MLFAVLAILMLSRLPHIHSADATVFSVGNSLSLRCPSLASFWILNQNSSTIVVVRDKELNRFNCSGRFESSTRASACREDINISNVSSSVEVQRLRMTDAGQYTCVHGENHIEVPWRHVTIVDEASKRLTVTFNGSSMVPADSPNVQRGSLLFVVCSFNFSGFIQPSMELLVRSENGSERVLASKLLRIGTAFNWLEEVKTSAQYGVTDDDSCFEIICKLQVHPANISLKAVFRVNAAQNDTNSATTSARNSITTKSLATVAPPSTDLSEKRHAQIVDNNNKPENIAAENITAGNGIRVGLPVAIGTACLIALVIGLAVYFVRKRQRKEYRDIDWKRSASSMDVLPGSTPVPSQTSMFGVTLCEVMARQRQHLPQSQSRLPWIQMEISKEILSHGGAEIEGIFRVPGDMVKAKEVRKYYEGWETPGAVCRSDLAYLNATVSVFKRWFMELKEPLIPVEFHARCIAACSDTTVACDIVQEFPEINRLVLQLLIWLLRELDTESSKMDAKNFAIVMAPSVFNSYEKGTIDFFQTLISSLDVSDVNDEISEIHDLVNRQSEDPDWVKL